MKQGISVPGWAIGVAVAIVAVILGVIGFRIAGGEGPRDPSTYPKSAYSPPSYGSAPGGAPSSGGSAEAMERAQSGSR